MDNNLISQDLYNQAVKDAGVVIDNFSKNAYNNLKSKGINDNNGKYNTQEAADCGVE